MDDNKRLTLLRLSAPIPKSNWPVFTCRNCGADSQKVTNLNSAQSAESKQAMSHEDWDPEWIEGSFAAISTCQACSDEAYMVGTYRLTDIWVNDESEEGGRIDYEEVFTIKYIVPAVELLKLPKGCPEPVREQIESAAEVIFTNTDLAANRLRASIETLLTEQGISRFKISGGKRVRLSTQARISAFEKKNKDAAELLEAVKWIGNEGSHGSSLTFADLITGLEIYDLALKLIYNNTTAALRKKAAAINKSRGIKKTPNPF